MVFLEPPDPRLHDELSTGRCSTTRSGSTYSRQPKRSHNRVVVLSFFEVSGGASKELLFPLSVLAFLLSHAFSFLFSILSYLKVF